MAVFVEKSIRAADRLFQVSVLRFANGRVIAVSEGEDRIGALEVSMNAGPGPVSSTVIPSRSDPMFARMTAERVSSLVKGVAVVSVSVQSAMGPDHARAVTSEIVEMVRNV